MIDNPISIIVDAAGNQVGIILDGAVYRLQTETKVVSPVPLPTGAATETTLSAIVNSLGVKRITDPLPAGANEIGAVAQGAKGIGSNAWPVSLHNVSGTPVTITNDAGVERLEVQGKVSIVGALPPPGTNQTVINADTPLTVGSDDTDFIIPDGETFRLQSIIAGNEDPTKGASIEVIYDDGSEHLIERVYTAGQTIAVSYSDIAEARDGTPLVGSGTSNSIIVRRAKFTGSNIAIDAVVFGYTT